MTPRQRSVLDVLRKAGRKLTWGEILDGADVPREQLSVLLARMVKSKLLVRHDASASERVSFSLAANPPPSDRGKGRISPQTKLARMSAAERKRFRSKLGERERAIFDNRLVADPPMTMRDLAESLQVSRQTVLNLERNILSALS